MRYGFVIDHNRCIGCHACTVACKEEHDVPLGVNRTWVKYIEKGEFPSVKRHFGVLRCNHCDDAPCIEICPTVALFRRQDGIVDFDGSRCIGCKSCMQACPYDALYIDPNTNTAAKCNFCAHRVEKGLEPACVIVCPEQAILAGDLDDASSRVSAALAMQKAAVRKPEKGTRPKLFYLGLDESLLQPSLMAPEGSHFWAEKDPTEDRYVLDRTKDALSVPGAAREVYDVSHPPPWGKMIAAYLWAKSLAAGSLLVGALLTLFGYPTADWTIRFLCPLLALFFLGTTTLLLILDLKRPHRFYFLLIKPNLRSWLVLGGYILLLYGFVALLWLLLGLVRGSVPLTVVWLGAILAAGSAGYSAFLFAQAKGRELWQSRLFFWHLLVQALVGGAAALILCSATFETGSNLVPAVGKGLGFSLIISLLMILGELWTEPASEEVKKALDLLRKGTLSRPFWSLVMGVGIFLPLLLIFWAHGSALGYSLASILSLAGLWVFEDLWVRAGQALPLS